MKKPSVGRSKSIGKWTSIVVSQLPIVDLSPDPWDNFRLALAEKGKADFLVTGDKAGLPILGRHGRTAIVTVRELLDCL